MSIRITQGMCRPLDTQTNESNLSAWSLGIRIFSELSGDANVQPKLGTNNLDSGSLQTMDYTQRKWPSMFHRE